MSVNQKAFLSINKEISQSGVKLIAVSKTKPNEDILELYRLGQRDFGENYVQEYLLKASQLPKDIRWHFIGHLQRNKVRSVLETNVYLIHSVDSLRLLREIDKQSGNLGKITNCLLQVHIASEQTKFGFGAEELETVFDNLVLESLVHVRICGLMGMATNTDNEETLQREFGMLCRLRDKFSQKYKEIQELSMGMSHDYPIAISNGSTMVRVGSLIFGQRDYGPK